MEVLPKINEDSMTIDVLLSKCFPMKGFIPICIEYLSLGPKLQMIIRMQPFLFKSIID